MENNQINEATDLFKDFCERYGRYPGNYNTFKEYCISELNGQKD